MHHRNIYRLASFTAFLLLLAGTTTHAQRARKTVEYNIAEGKTGQLAGKVTADGSPLQGVRVVLSYKGDGIAEATTGADGAYSFKELNPDQYDLSFFKTGYQKRIVNEIPVVETYVSGSEVALHKLTGWYEERHPKELTFEQLKHHSIEKTK